MRARPLVAAALALAAAACGDTLVDHRAGDLLLPDACDPAACPAPVGLGTGAVAACVAGACGYACTGGLLKCSGGCCAATQVAAGEAHTCAIAGAPAAGELYCWGANESGQVSPHVISAVFTTPLRVASGVVAVALGRAHTCAARSGGAVECWGSNGQGQAPPTASVTSARALAAGASHTCAIDASDAVRCWGAGMPAAPALGGAALALVSGADHACALVGDVVKCWGAGAAGQLGVDPAPLSTTEPLASLGGIAAVAAGSSLGCAATAVPNEVGGVSDALQCWGTGLGALLGPDQAQLTAASPMKRADQSVVRSEVASLAVGRAHVCVVRRDAAQPQPVECLGPDNSFGQLGSNVDTTTQPPPEPDAVPVPETAGALGFALGADHGCAVLANGALRCWGRNSSGQLGDGTLLTPGVDDGGVRLLGTPVPVAGL